MQRRDFLKMLGMATAGSMVPGAVRSVIPAANSQALDSAGYRALFTEMGEALNSVHEWTTPITQKSYYCEAMEYTTDPWARKELLNEMINDHRYYTDADSLFPADELRHARAHYRNMSIGKEEQLRQMAFKENAAMHQNYAKQLAENPTIKTGHADQYLQKLIKQDQIVIDEHLRVFNMNDAEFEHWLKNQTNSLTGVNRANAETIRNYQQSIAKETPAEDVPTHAAKAFSLQVKVSRKLRDNGFNLQVSRSARGDGMLESPSDLAERTATMIGNLQDAFPDDSLQVENTDFKRGRVVALVDKGSELEAFLDAASQQRLAGSARSA